MKLDPSRLEPAADEQRDIHIASFVVQHRIEASATIDEYIAAHDDLDLAVRAQTRSVVLCECPEQYAVLDRVDALRALPGVLNVALVYHHAEPRDALDAPLRSAPELKASGAAS